MFQIVEFNKYQQDLKINKIRGVILKMNETQKFNIFQLIDVF